MNPLTPHIYPRWMEQWWIDEFLGLHVRQKIPSRGYAPIPDTSEPPPRTSLAEGKALTQLRTRVEALSELFTTGRMEGFEQYARERKLLQAYGLFYFPQTFVRTQIVMGELLQRWTPPEQKVSILDCGAGTGAAGLAAAMSLGVKGRKVFLHAVDSSIQSMKLVQELVSGTRADWNSPILRTSVADLSAPLSFAREAGRRHDVVTASFVLNEIFQGVSPEKALAWCRELLTVVARGGVLIIMEPALKESSERLEWIRDQLVSEGKIKILAPCPHRRKCPLLAEGKFHCHEVREWAPPESLSMINRKLLRAVEKTLKFSFLVLSPAHDRLHEDAGQGENWRMISPWTRGKGKWFATGCNDAGQKALYEIQSRDLPPDAEERFARMERGDRLQVSPSKLRVLGDGYRIESLDDLSVQRPLMGN